MLNVVKDFGKKMVEVFKKASWVKRIFMILATIALVDLLTSSSFYKFLFIGILAFFVFRLIKSSAIYTVVSTVVLDTVNKVRNKKTKTNE